MTYEEEAFEDAVSEGITTKVPTKYIVCERCQGHGGHSGHLGYFTGEEWALEDDEFKSDYMAGKYDKVCERCGGKRVVETLDREVASETLIKFIDSYVQAAYDADAIHAQEMRYHV